MTQLRDLARLLKANHVMFALDACFSGALLAAKGPAGTRERTSAWVKEMLQTPVRFVLTAGTAEQEAVEVGRSGLFTTQLLAALGGDAAGSGGVLTGTDIGTFVQRRVIEEAARYGRKQTPQFGPMIGQGTGEFLLAKLPPALGSLAFSSKTVGVEVWIRGAGDADDRKVGEIRPGPALVLDDLPAGPYWVRARKADHKDWEQLVQVVENRKLDVAIDIEPLGPARVIKGGGDDAEMVLVPAGKFWMGSTREEVDRAIEVCKKCGTSEMTCKDWYERELPRHQVFIDAFYIDRYEVTNALFERFVRATGHRTTAGREGSGWAWQQKDGKWQMVQVDGAEWRRPSGPGSSAEGNHPVVQVSWHDAEAYCKWSGKRLPTAAEWETAARGTDGRRYPWGDAWDAGRANGNMNVESTTPVGNYPAGASPYGAHDMAGNVWEWTADWYDEDSYKQSIDRNPPGPASGQAKVPRGVYLDAFYIDKYAYRAV